MQSHSSRLLLYDLGMYRFLYLCCWAVLMLQRVLEQLPHPQPQSPFFRWRRVWRSAKQKAMTVNVRMIMSARFMGRKY